MSTIEDLEEEERRLELAILDRIKVSTELCPFEHLYSPSRSNLGFGVDQPVEFQIILLHSGCDVQNETLIEVPVQL